MCGSRGPEPCLLAPWLGQATGGCEELDLPRRPLSPGVAVRRAAGPAGQLRFRRVSCVCRRMAASLPSLATASSQEPQKEARCAGREENSVRCVHTRELACTSAQEGRERLSPGRLGQAEALRDGA